MSFNQVKSEIVSCLKACVIAIMIVIICRTFLFTPTLVSGESMMPNYQDGNCVIISKMSEIDRFDTVVFQAPSGDGNYVKRVIGLPGDRVEMKDDLLYINGAPHPESYLLKAKEHLNGTTVLTGDFTLQSVTGLSTVPDGYVFVLGDNRLISNDSRYFGYIPTKSIIGEVKFKVWPLQQKE
ncbi:signal peptidase I [Bacillus cihuensis]|uniref:signal peptidase I n=1 Tax=Bacillus cihuensis TaxID=1208599 RepID=UPI0003FD80A7|nr:signal peptidase I [Bacillus cihuensis]